MSVVPPFRYTVILASLVFGSILFGEWPIGSFGPGDRAIAGTASTHPARRCARPPEQQGPIGRQSTQMNHSLAPMRPDASAARRARRRFGAAALRHQRARAGDAGPRAVARDGLRHHPAHADALSGHRRGDATRRRPDLRPDRSAALHPGRHRPVRGRLAPRRPGGRDRHAAPGARSSRRPAAGPASRSPGPSCATRPPRTSPPASSAIITMAMVVSPMVAPLVGGFLDARFGWRSIFVGDAGHDRLRGRRSPAPCTKRRSATRTRLASLFRGYPDLLRDRRSSATPSPCPPRRRPSSPSSPGRPTWSWR